MHGKFLIEDLTIFNYQRLDENLSVDCKVCFWIKRFFYEPLME